MLDLSAPRPVPMSAARAGGWRVLFAASPALTDVADQRRAELLASLLLVFVVLGAASGIVQLVLIPGFLPTFLAMFAALSFLALAYGLSRTRWYRAGAVIAVIAPMAACVAVGISNPADRVWYAFLAVGVLFATLFLRIGEASFFAFFAFLACACVVALAPGYGRPAMWVPPLAFQAIFSPLIVIVAANRSRVEGDRNRAQRALEEADRLATIGRLASGIAHDFGNLLTVVRLSTDSMASRDPGQPELRNIQEVTARATSLVSQLIAYVRRKPLTPTEVRLGDLVQDLSPLLQILVGRDVEMLVHCDPTAPDVRAHVTHLEQVIVNLVVNARDAMPDGGTLTIRVTAKRVLPADSAALQVAAGWYAVLSVSDNGVGMPEEVRARVFEPFFSTKAEGASGIGLATVYDVVRQIGGNVTVESQPGAGATFTAYLPALTGETGKA